MGNTVQQSFILLGDNLVTNRSPQSGSLTQGFSGEEGVKNSLANLSAHSRSVIGDRYSDDFGVQHLGGDSNFWTSSLVVKKRTRQIHKIIDCTWHPPTVSYVSEVDMTS